jgi:hypothetical protein
MKKLAFIIGSFLLLVCGTQVALVSPVHAVDIDYCKDAPAGSAICAKKSDNLGSLWKKIVNVLIFIVGILAVLMIIFGAFRYTTSAGDAKALGEAKNIILYSVVGVAVAFSAYAIVNFVVGAF